MARVSCAARDNTGAHRYVEGVCLPLRIFLCLTFVRYTLAHTPYRVALVVSQV